MAQASRSTRTAKPRAKAPARKTRRRTKKRARHHDAELVGLGLARGRDLPGLRALVRASAAGRCRTPPRGVIGWAAYISPLILIPLGGLIVTRSALVSVRPFRLGLCVTVVGLMLALGSSHGGWIGRQLSDLVAKGIGTTGATILGVLLTLFGVLFLTGASLGALLRSSGTAVRSAHTRVRRERTPRPLSRSRRPRTSPPTRSTRCPSRRHPSTPSTTTRTSSPHPSPRSSPS